MGMRFGLGLNRPRGGGGTGSTAPAAFTAGQWSVADAAAGGQATVTISALPSTGGSAITALQYSIAGGAWTAFSGTGTGSYTIGGFTNGVATNVNIRAVNAVGSGATSDTKSVTTSAAATAPAAFTAGQWSVADAAAGGQATVTITALPSTGGSAVTALQYSIAGGAWTAFSGTGTGSYTIGGFTNGVATNVNIRAVNAVGSGATSDTKSVTTSAAATAPAAFTAGQWSVADAAAGGQATVTITALPSTGGSAITALQYRIDGGSWLPFVGTGTGARTIGGFTDGILANVNIRAVNAVGNGATSDTKTVTTSVAATAPSAFTVAMWDVLNAASGNDATFNILALPTDGNSAITALQYRIGAGAWTAFSAATTGSYTVAGFTDNLATIVLVRAVNAVGNGPDSDTKSVTTTAAPLDQVVDFVSGGSDRLQQDFAWLDSGGSLPTGGVWLMGFAYYNGTNWSGSVISAGDPAAADRYFELNANYVVYRNAGQAVTADIGAPSSAGWYLCTAWARRLNATTFDRATHFRNDVTTVANTSVGGFSISSWPRIGLGARILNAATNHANFRAAGFAAGWGDPTALHAWLYNGGAFGRDIRDYPGDAGVTVRHYWVAARSGSTTFSVSDAALVDVIGGADSWTQVGSPVWSPLSPPFDASVVTSSVTSATVPSGATNTLVVTSTIPAGSWGGTPTVDTAKVEIFARRGMGPINVSGTSVNVSGLTATTTITLDRPVYASERVQCVLGVNWLTVPGKMQSNNYVADITNNSPTADPANWPGISHGNIYGAVGWRFQTPVPAGYHTDGIPWCQPCTIVSEYPARASGLHGAEQNPVRRLVAHRFDSRKSAYSGAPVALPWTLADKDTVIKVKSNPFPNSAGEGSASQPIWFNAYGGLVCRASAPAANEYAPPLVWDTPSTRPAGPTLDVATLSFPSPYSTAGHPRPTASEMIQRVQIFNPAVSLWGGVEERRQGIPTGVTRAGGYPQEIAGSLQGCGLVMIGDDTVANKREIAKGFLMNGVQWYDTIDASAVVNLPNDGGQNQGFLLPIVLSLVWTGRTSRLATLQADLETNELGQSFQITAPLLSQMTTRDATTTTYHAVGQYEWTIRGTAGIPTNYAAGPTAPYRANNKWTGTLLVLKSLGYLHSSFANFQGAVRRANTQDYVAGTGWPTHHNVIYGAGGPFQWENAFWNAHWTAIDAVPQTVG